MNIYSGVSFKTSLERRWAIFFDHLGIKWKYEPTSFVLPDGTICTPSFVISWKGDTSETIALVFDDNVLCKQDRKVVSELSELEDLIVLDGEPDIGPYVEFGDCHQLGFGIEHKWEEFERDINSRIGTLLFSSDETPKYMMAKSEYEGFWNRSYIDSAVVATRLAP